MTSEQAITEIKALQRFFGQQYKGRDLNPVWSQLLQHEHKTLKNVVSEAQRAFTSLPDLQKILKMCDEYKAGAIDGDCPAEALGLLRAYLEDRLTLDQYSYGLKLLADKYKRPGFKNIINTVYVP